ncbi:RecF/RecN/SMC protein [Lipomyces doorenjongii]|uniref:RecF/RecN/SMC protein n=1 Tax=Lipomyces doorenjongii TaxID=383834 RepID=UPI0034CFA699
MGQLTRIEVSNFKSYKSTQTIDFGPSYFTSIIGPNGAGKSNMMDAISFVLGIKSSHLRSSQLKDLVYRGRILSESNDGPTQTGNDPTTASVTAVYVKDDGAEMHLKRSITIQGSSEYRLNGKVVSALEYSRALEEENILIKARNFLVFQGDVEAIAAQSPRDLTRLIEQISGSLEYKAEYDNQKLEQERATEASNAAFSKKRAYHSEIKQYQDQKAEVEIYEEKLAEKESAIITHILWKLYHYGRVIDTSNVQIDVSNDELERLRSELSVAQALLDTSKTEHAKSVRQSQKQIRAIRKIERLMEEKATSMVPVEEKIKVINSNEKQRLARQRDILTDFKRQEATVSQLKQDINSIDKAVQQFEEQQQHSSRESGISLSEVDLQEYSRLKETFNRQAAKENGRLDNLLRQKRTDEDSLSTFRSKIDEYRKQKARLEEEIVDLTARHDQTSARINHDLQDLASKKQQLNDIVSERLQQTAEEQEINEKLQKCVNELIDVNADRRESERELRLKETISSLKRLIPGVRGRVSDLCKPKQRKYETAMITVLGRNIDAVVVDTQRTASDCITYLREQRAGISTFIPLDSVIIKPISTSLRGMHKQMRLAIDTIDFDPSNERAMQYVCGNSVVCDDLDVAKYIRWEKAIDAKAVTLDGSVIHKGGLMTGGRSNTTQNRKWEDQAVKGLQKLKENLLTELAELAKNKHILGVEDALSGDIDGLEQRLGFEREQLAVIKRTLQGRQSELEFVDEHLHDLVPKLNEAEINFERTHLQASELETNVRNIENELFSSFCRKIGVTSIRRYEEFQGLMAQEISMKRLEFTSQKTRLANQLRFEQERLNETAERLNNITSTMTRERQLINQLQAEKAAIKEEIDILQAEMATLNEDCNKHRDIVAEKSEELAKNRAEVQKVTKNIEKHSKEMAALQEELEKTYSLRTGILRNCKLEGINIPLLEGSLADIPIGEEAVTDNRMQVDEDSAASQLVQTIEDFGITINFDSLDPELRENGRHDVEETLLDKIRILTSEMETMTPNMKAVERLEEIEGRLDDTEKEFDKARRDAKNSKDSFNSIKEKRLDLFNKAYTHISEQIDKIYKELTKSKSFPLGGTAYLTVEDQDEPYLDGIKYHAMPPMKRFRDMEQLSGGEKTMAALALLFAIHSYRPSPFFVLDEVDAALDNANVAKIANYIHDHAGPRFQFIVISLKNALFQRSDALVGIYRAQVENSSRALTLDLKAYPE